MSNIPGTTRDAIDSPFRFGDKDYILVDTAGIRRKRSIEDESIERYSVIRSLAAIDRCDVVLVMIDATEGVTEQDSKIAGYAHNAGKASIVVVNKWDLVEKETNTMKNFKNVQPPSDKGRRLKIYYITQASTRPPAFILFVNDKELAHFSYVRYIENKIRETFNLNGTPVKFIIRERGEKND